MALSVTDVEMSAKFYTEVLQFEPIPIPPEFTEIRWLSMGNGKELHLISAIKEEVKTNKAIHLAFSVSDFDSFIQRLTEINITYSDFPGNVNAVNIRPDGIKQIFFRIQTAIGSK